MREASQHRGVAGLKHTCWDGESEESLTKALDFPALECVEAGVTARSLNPSGSSTERRIDLTVTARSVYRYPVAKVFAQALQTRLDLSADVHDRVRIALQEALMNALLHGNLGLDSGLRDNLETFAATRAVIDGCFTVEALARSPICLAATWTNATLQVIVRDSGRGFEAGDLPSPEDRIAAGRVGSGRGLMILQTVCNQVSLRDGGTTIALGFALPCG